jgi:hypothetical protein
LEAGTLATTSPKLIIPNSSQADSLVNSKDRELNNLQF